MNFKDLKKNSSQNLQNLVEELDKMKTGGKSYDDPRFWKPSTNEKTGNGTALIRFLPSIDSSQLPWTIVYSHSFKGPGGWYIENSLTTIGKQDAVGESNSELWQSGIDANKEVARNRKRKTNYISNILVLSDPVHPENEGKVFLYKYGKKIFQKIQEKMVPTFDNEVAVDPFDFWNGANFRLKIAKVAGYPNYDNSLFENQSPLLNGDDAELEKIWKQQHNLSEFTDPKNFKSYDELKKRFEKVLGTKTDKPELHSRKSVVAAAEQDDAGVPWNEVSKASDDEDDMDDFLKKLAED